MEIMEFLNKLNDLICVEACLDNRDYEEVERELHFCAVEQGWLTFESQ